MREEQAAAGEISAVRERYERFARDEAPGRSALYTQWAAGVAAGPDVSEVLARIPATHRQPPLVFAVTRMLGAPLADFRTWAAFVLAHADDIVAECRRRRLQTNEPLRCAALLPALSLIPGPIALLEVGASAGLCLYPDRYAYRYAGGPELGSGAVVLESELRGRRIPALRLPEIVWRAGIDLHPRDARDADDRAWLRALVWPGEEGREERISAALDVAATDPPLLVAGDATDSEVIRSLADRAPKDATLVITTPGVLAHIPREGRERLIAAIIATGARWITLDDPTLHDAWHPSVRSELPGFVLALDEEILAWADPLGGWVEWIGAPEASTTRPS